MTVSNDQLTEFISTPKYWCISTKLHTLFQDMTPSQIKYLLWKRGKDPVLDKCCKLIGKSLYVNVPMFTLWMSSALPEQAEVHND